MSHTPRQFGSQRFQVQFHVPRSAEASSESFSLSHLKSDGDQDWPAFLAKVTGWLNASVPPHCLVSVSIFEEAHPNEGGILNAVIVHTAGNIQEGSNLNEGEVYTLKQLSKAGEVSWKQTYSEAIAHSFNQTDSHNYVVAANPVCKDNGKLMAVWSYDRNKAEQIKDKLRPTGCCTLF